MRNKIVYIIVAIILVAILGVGIIATLGNSEAGNNSSESESLGSSSQVEQESESTSQTEEESEITTESESATEIVTEQEPNNDITESDTSNTEKPNTNTEKPDTNTEKPSTETEKPDTNTENGNGGNNGNVTDEPTAPTYTYTDMNKTMYAKSSVNVRDLPSTDGKKVGSLKEAEEVMVTGQCKETGWYRINFGATTAYVSDSYLVTEKPTVEETPDTNGGSTDSGSAGGDTNNGGTTTNKPQNNAQYSYEDRDGDGYADLADYTEMGGMLVYTVDIKPDYAYFKKELSEAGLYQVKMHDEKYYVLAPTFEEGYLFMKEWLKERGLKPQNASNITWTKDGSVHCCMVYRWKEIE